MRGGFAGDRHFAPHTRGDRGGHGHRRSRQSPRRCQQTQHKSDFVRYLCPTAVGEQIVDDAPLQLKVLSLSIYR